MTSAKGSRIATWRRKFRPGDFLRQLVIVILGIFITLTATNYFSGISKKKEFRQIMEMVHAELVDNKAAIDDALDRMVFLRETMQYFYDNRDRIAELPSDSVTRYYPVLRLFDYYNYTDHALEVLKYSSSIHSTRDLSVVRDIMEAYDNLELCQLNISSYYDHKEEFRKSLDNEVNGRGPFRCRIADGSIFEPIDVGLYSGYRSIRVHTGMPGVERSCRKCYPDPRKQIPD